MSKKYISLFNNTNDGNINESYLTHNQWMSIQRDNPQINFSKLSPSELSRIANELSDCKDEISEFTEQDFINLQNRFKS